MKLSIIIPYYKTYELTKNLLETLIPQLTKEIEVLIIDDGCNELRLDEFKKTNIKILHKKENSGNASVPRNIGLDMAIGEYITFIDSDDMISNNYIEKILQAIKLNKDIIYLSWEYPGHKQIMTIKPPTWNCSVWCRVYKKELIGKTRFREDLKIAEDWDFNQKITPKTSCCIKDIIYYYNSGREGSLTNG
jgi:glycosyltransferase involved in cell wall biosynthesis